MTIMPLHQLRTFIEVYRQHSISKAARVLGMTQPAVSQHMASLEAQIGRPLFERHARGVRATVVADDLAAGLGDTLDKAEAALAGVRARSVQLSGVVHIAAPADYMAENLTSRLGALLAAGLELRLHAGGRDALYGMLLNDRVDLAFTASKPDDPRLAFRQIGVERLLAVAAPEVAERIAAIGNLAEALTAVPHLAYDLERPLLRNWITANQLPIPARLPVVTIPDLRVARALLCDGAGWSVLPNYLCNTQLREKTLTIIPSPVHTPENAFYLVWAKSSLRHPRIAFARDTLLRASG